MSERQLLLRVETLERTIAHALRAARRNDLPKVILALRRIEVDESKYPEPVPVTKADTWEGQGPSTNGHNA
jgi:hypothetical protein